VKPSRELWRPAYVGIGSNLDGPVAHIERAFEALRRLPDSGWFVRSSFYCSVPLGPPDQPDFVNAAAAILTRLAPHDLLGALQGIENAEGRSRHSTQWGPRTLDLDLLVLGGLTINDDRLTLPHPRIAERNFVLLPLAEIAPHLNVPGIGSVALLLSRISSTEPRIERIVQPGNGQ
jgi:2-amino-4-hydroxy-6-hydroxymethyldihydropteridine diphosphokinase